MIRKEKSLHEVRALLEKNQIVQDFIAFIQLPILEQQRIFDLWEAHYLASRKTVLADIFFEMRDASKKNNWVRFHDLLAQSKQMRKDGVAPELKKPKYTEPLALYNDQLVIRYRNVLSDIRNGGSNGDDL